MTGDTLSHSRGAIRPSFAVIFRPERAWGMPGADAPAAWWAKRVEVLTSGSHHEFTGNTRHSRTQWSYRYSVLSPAIGLFCHRRLRGIWRLGPVGPQHLREDLTPASRCQDHTTSLYATPSTPKGFDGIKCPSSARPLMAHGSFDPPFHHVARKHRRVHRIPFRIVDVAQRPSE
jgi:hypothetical protein